MKLEVQNGVIQLTEKQWKYLNSIERVSDLPSEFDKPTLTSKAEFIDRPDTGRCTIASEAMEKGEIICRGDSSLLNKPIKYSWQINEEVHQLGPGALDHNCVDPTCEYDPDTGNMLARRFVNKGEILSFNYLTTEYIMKEPFECKCGEQGCFKFIKGFKFLSEEEKKVITKNFRIAPFLSKYI